MNQTSVNWTEEPVPSQNNSLWAVSLSASSLWIVYSVSKAIFYFLFCVGGFLDVFVIYVMVRSGQLRRNISSFLIFHLSFTHLLFHVVLAIMSFKDGSVSERSVLRCKMSAFIEHACPAAIFSTLVAIAWDRQKNILQPFKSLVAKSVKSYLLMVAVIWTYAVVSSVAFVHSVSVRTYNDRCRMVTNNTKTECIPYTLCHKPPDWKTQTSETVYFMVALFIPLSYMLVAYTRIAVRLYKRSKYKMIHSAVAKHKTKSIRLLVAAVLGFVICWGPSILFRFFNQYLLSQSFVIFILNIWFNYTAPASSSCVNTAVYAYFSPEFRKNCIKFGCCCCSPFRRFIQRCRCRRVRGMGPSEAVGDRTKENVRLERIQGSVASPRLIH